MAGNPNSRRGSLKLSCKDQGAEAVLRLNPGGEMRPQAGNVGAGPLGDREGRMEGTAGPEPWEAARCPCRMPDPQVSGVGTFRPSRIPAADAQLDMNRSSAAQPGDFRVRPVSQLLLQAHPSFIPGHATRPPHHPVSARPGRGHLGARRPPWHPLALKAGEQRARPRPPAPGPTCSAGPRAVPAAASGSRRGSILLLSVETC